MANNRRNRNLVTGLLVCVTSIVAVTYYLEVPSGDVAAFFLGTLLFFGIILLLAVLAVVILKSIGRLLKRDSQESDNSSE